METNRSLEKSEQENYTFHWWIQNKAPVKQNQQGSIQGQDSFLITQHQSF